MITDKATWESFSTYEEYMQYDIQYFRDLAAERGISYEEFLAKSVLKKGDSINLNFPTRNSWPKVSL